MVGVATIGAGAAGAAPSTAGAAINSRLAAGTVVGRDTDITRMPARKPVAAAAISQPAAGRVNAARISR